MSRYGVSIGSNEPPCGVEQREPRVAVLPVGADDAAAAVEAVAGHPEGPLRHAEFGRHRLQRLDLTVALPVEVPPAAAVGDEVQLALRRPRRLEDRFVAAAGDALRRLPGCRRRPGSRTHSSLPSHGMFGWSQASHARRLPSGLRHGDEKKSWPPASSRCAAGRQIDRDQCVDRLGSRRRAARAPRSGGGAGCRRRGRHSARQASWLSARGRRSLPRR